MEKFVGTCSPEQLHTLQRIFDLIWMELRGSTTSQLTSLDPDALREEIARRVLNQFEGDSVNAKDITKRVLNSFGIQTESLRSASAGK